MAATSSRSRPSTAGSSREGTVASVSLGVPPSPHRSTYANHQDLYTHNALNSFSFGAASTAAPITRSIDPLSPVRDDDFDEGSFKADTTPRPSLVSSPSPRSHSSQLPPMQPESLPPPPRRRPATAERIRTTSSSSKRSFGPSSASASASSLSSAAAMDFSAESQRGDSSVTSEDDDEEHRHPIPATPSFLSQSADKLSLYGSDDDLDEDFADDYEPDIEISSVINNDPDPTPDFSTFDNRSKESFQPSFVPRRGSLAVPIPSPSAVEGRDREDSIATLRRPSRSLEGLRSDSRAEGETTRSSDSRPQGPSPTSVPESASDWRDIRRLSSQRDPIGAGTAPGNALASHNNVPSVSSSSTAVHNSALDGFDSSWNIDPVTGIVGLDWDQSEMQDIVGGFEGPPSSNRSYRRGSSSTESGRRLSTTSTNSDPFFKGLSKWGGQVYQDEKEKWTFKREKADRLEEHKSHERERGSIGNLIGRKQSYTGPSTSSIGAFQDFGHYSKDGKSYSRDSSKKDVQPWRGMAVGAEEWWSSYTNGRYRVVRQNQPNADPMKPFQQRLNVSNHRTPYSAKSYGHDGPTSTIHKHSKANGFSISRHYRTKKRPSVAQNGRPSTSSRATTTIGGEPEQPQRPSNMVLLAPRRVQEQYTSTNTTRKLESHGLLSDGRHYDSKDLERLMRIEREKKERAKKEKEKEKQRQKELRKAEVAKSKDKGKSKSANSASATDSGSSVGSVVSEPQANPVPAAGPSHLSHPSADHRSVLSQDTVSSDRTVVTGQSQRNVRDGPDYDFDDYVDDDDDFDDSIRRRRPPSRTPHAEVFSPLPPETLESFVHQDSHSRRTFLPWGQSKNNSNLPRPLENVYKPQWPVASASRHQNEKKGMTLETLNTSFQDVGLLPAVDEVKGSSRSSKRKQHGSKQGKGDKEKENVFHSFSSEYLYMLLPLWPGETDAMSTSAHPYPPLNLSLESRKYLLVYYCPEDNGADRNKGTIYDVGKKQRPRPSPTSSRDSTTKHHDKHILLDKFHFSARIVSYADIQGSGVRSPDVGLSVLGPLQEAIETMPTHSNVDTFQVIGMCASRERGIEFIPEGLEKLGLARRVPDPQMAPDEHDPPPPKRFSITGVEESDEVSDTMLVLTPIGRAVVEMAWLGAMALTSFAPPN
ncbi:hypothetical protein NMY22_g3237 [Coprinellus aureogranulatus]|nr:hypothetical protein NMY22_g3237 [Coprinellus aureogranulatus]